MKYIFFPGLLLFHFFLHAQTLTPDKLWGSLFEDVQLTHALGDGKTFVDMLPQHPPATILKKYSQLQHKDSVSLRSFVLANFYLPGIAMVDIPATDNLINHLTQLWNTLTRKADTVRKYSSLLPLPKSYVVPGGRFREIYYWDSYFTILGLAASNRYDLIENMLDNFKYLVETYGHIPNGNRTYYLSRSQPPYFALMVQLLQQKKGDAVYKKYFAALQKDYAWWMQGEGVHIEPGMAYRRIVRLHGDVILNRYYDDTNTPRQESYLEDVLTSKYAGKGDKMVYRNLRAGAESGWDFSSRWLADTNHLTTIETINIIPVDLNCLLYNYECILSEAAKASGQIARYNLYRQKAANRKTAILNYCWDEEAEFFFDYHFVKKHRTGIWTLAGVMPLFSGIATPDQAEAVKNRITQKFLRDGGVATSLYKTLQQWDAPNGWAPLQFITVKALMNYGHIELAKTIAERWMKVNEKVFAATGKMLEKYNVEDLRLESGGGEYPTQDGFGWTNGVYLKLAELFPPNKSKEGLR